MPAVPTPSKTAERTVLAAAKLFARQGYHGTSTREIARVAGVSENTLFRHFDNKEDLFWSALLWHTSGLRFRRDLQEGLERGDPPAVVLPKLFEFLTDTATYKPELVRLVAVAYLELHAKIEAYCREHFAPMLSALEHYLAGHARQGTIQGRDTTMLTTALLSSTLMQPGVARLLAQDNLSGASSKDPARPYANFWLELLLPRGQSALRERAVASESPTLPDVEEC